MTENKNEVIAKAINTIKGWMVEIKFEDDFDLTLYMQYAGRLAALGDNSGIEVLPTLLERPKYKGRIDELVEGRTKEGNWDLDEQLYEYLAHSVIEAQDFYSFSRHCGNIISDKSKSLIEEWADHASNVELDDEAVECLEAYLQTYPINEDDQIATVAAPLSKTQLGMIDRVIASITDVFYYTPEYDEENGWSCQVDDLLIKKVITPDNNLAVVFPDCVPEYYPNRVTLAGIHLQQKNRTTWVLPLYMRLTMSFWTEKNKEYLKGAAPVVFWTNAISKKVCKF